MTKTSYILSTLDKYKQHAEDQGLTVFAIALKGSQNYNLDDSESDIDANLVFIPSFKDLREDTTYKFTFPEGECTCHNLYSFAQIVAKGNPQWIEVCNTEYIIGDLSMFKHYKLNPSALKGMFMEKVAAFKKLYPSRAKYVEKFGYDPKQLHHIIRLYDLLEKDVPIYKYFGSERDLLVSIKRGLLTEADADKMLKDYIEKLNALYEDKKIAYSPQPIDYDLLDNIMLQYLLKA